MKITTTLLQTISVAIALNAVTGCANDAPKKCDSPVTKHIDTAEEIVTKDTAKIIPKKEEKDNYSCPKCGRG